MISLTVLVAYSSHVFVDLPYEYVYVPTTINGAYPWSREDGDTTFN